MAILRVNVDRRGTILRLTSDDGKRALERIVHTTILQTTKRPDLVVLKVLGTMEQALGETA